MSYLVVTPDEEYGPYDCSKADARAEARLEIGCKQLPSGTVVKEYEDYSDIYTPMPGPWSVVEVDPRPLGAPRTWKIVCESSGRCRGTRGSEEKANQQAREWNKEAGHGV